MVRALVSIVLAFWLAGAAALAAHAEARLALLIGNQDYAAKVGPLKNPLRDIELVGAALEKLGFSVTKLANANKAQMDEAIRRHADRVRRAGPGAISFFYYSGHGAVNPETNVNYLIPADLDSAESDTLWYRSIEQPYLIELLSQRAKNATHFASARELHSFVGHTKGVESVAFSPDGRYALSGSQDQTLKMWDIASGRELRTFTGHTGSVLTVAFSPDGRYALSGGADKTLKLWDVSEWTQPHEARR
ncbi:MAG: caspase family protein [Rhodomicrobium sp.]